MSVLNDKLIFLPTNNNTIGNIWISTFVCPLLRSLFFFPKHIGVSFHCEFQFFSETTMDSPMLL